jgi:hypothetical protein
VMSEGLYNEQGERMGETSTELCISILSGAQDKGDTRHPCLKGAAPSI